MTEEINIVKEDLEDEEQEEHCTDALPIPHTVRTYRVGIWCD